MIAKSVINELRRLRMVAGLLLLSALLAGPAWMASLFTVTVLAEGGATFHTPLDATPDPEGALTYFVAQASNGEPGVFMVPTAGGAVEGLLVGAPLVAPRGIVVSTDGATLYVADPETGQGGAVLTLPVNGGPVSSVPGTEGLYPRALDLVREGTRDVLYVAGMELPNRRAEVWRLVPGESESLVPVLRGSFLAVADGVAVASNGKVYVAGHRHAAHTTGVVLEVDGRSHRLLVRSIRLGNPAGLALSVDQAQLLVSSLAGDGTSQVLIVDLPSGNASPFNEVIGVNRASGGLHRAHRSDYFAWAGTGPPGAVYGVEP